ncbi:MAG: sulfatase-like hydrolase/transferase [Planctomycetes bacterium]|nr:sulfatase-like hydrolase/transferase [Planctomycetota bacterium]
MTRLGLRLFPILLPCALVDVAHAQQSSGRSPPNIVFIMADNLGYGEVGCYGGGILRGAPTPRIDALASQGLKLLNYNVESQCTPSRSALLTGRFPIRSGTVRVPRGEAAYGLTQWEITLAELLAQQGYATGHFGKWHLGDQQGRYPTDQGFDEWYGIPNSTSVSPWTSAVGFDPAVAPTPHIMEGRRGGSSRKVEPYDLRTRRLIDTEVTRRAVDFIRRHAQARRPMFCYVPFTLVHYPTLPHPDFAGKTGNGDWADALAEMDHHVGQIVDAVEQSGISDNTIVVFTSDNGPEEGNPYGGWAGPWSGSYFTALEGSLRVPFILRWPGQTPAGRVSNEIVHQVDVFTTFAAIAGAPLPYKHDPPQKLPLPRMHYLIDDPRERHDVVAMNTWVYLPTNKIRDEFEASLRREPPIAVGTPDPYYPHQATGR